MSALVIAEHDNQTLNVSTLSTIAAANKLGSEIDIAVLGSGSAEVAKAASAVEGIRQVIHVDNAALEHGLAENLAPVIVDMASEYSHVLAPASTFGKNLMPRVAALLDVQQISDISDVIDADTFERPIYAGNAIATVKSSDAIKIITVRGTKFDAVASEGGSAEIIEKSDGEDAGLATFVKLNEIKSDRPELTTAGVVVSGGRGMASKENFAMLDALADKLGAAVGASRAAVDSGYAPNDYQVGQTGKVVAPDLYMAIGISGAIQHLAGMKDSKTIVAINNDPEAPIFQVADYGLVADLFDAVPELTEKL